LCMAKRKGEKCNKKLDETEFQILDAIANEPNGEFLVPAGSEEQVKEFLNCAWRRIPCGKDTCPICGRINRQTEKLIKEGKDPDSLESVFECVGANLAEVLAMAKKDAERHGIDIANLDDVADAPSEFVLSNKVTDWYVKIVRLYERESKGEAPWLETEEAADLIWYAGTLSAKTYRQLCNQWYLENEKEYGDFDYEYTGEVLKEVLKILNKSLFKLGALNMSIRRLHKEFNEFKPAIIKI